MTEVIQKQIVNNETGVVFYEIQFTFCNKTMLSIEDYVRIDKAIRFEIEKLTNINNQTNQ